MFFLYNYFIYTLTLYFIIILIIFSFISLKIIQLLHPFIKTFFILFAVKLHSFIK